MAKNRAKPKPSKKPAAARQWPVGPDPGAGLIVELRPIFSHNALFIERQHAGFVVISLEEAEALAALLPVVVAAARGDNP